MPKPLKLLACFLFAAVCVSVQANDLAKLFEERGYDPDSVALPVKLPAAALQDVVFEKVADLELFPEGPSYRPSDDSYFFAGNVALTRVDADNKLHVVLEEPGGGGTHFLPDGSVLLIGKSGLRRIYPDGRIALLADGNETGGGNDITMGKHGEIYFSAPGRGIYRLTPGKNGRLELVTDKGANGLDVDPSGDWLYVAAGGVQRHRIGGLDQPLGERELVCELPKGQGGGDGCAFDVWGNFYTMHFGTGVIRVIDPKQKALIATIATGVVPASNLTFGGPKNTDLFVTAGAPKHGNCQVLKAKTRVVGFPGHAGARVYPEIRILGERADEKGFASPVLFQDAAADERVDFEREVLPIFAEKCFNCHGAEASKPKGGVKLDDRESLLAELGEDGSIVAGDPDGSDLLYLMSLDPADDDVMPPAKENRAVTKAELATVEAWIRQGVDLGEFVRFEPEAKPALVVVISNEEARDAKRAAARIDELVTNILRRDGRAVGERVDDATFLRRVYLDLIGRNPAAAEARAFLDDESPAKRAS